MSTRQYLTDVTTRHAVFLQRYASGESRKAQNTLSRLARSIQARLGQEPTTFQKQRLETVLADIVELNKAAFGEITETGLQGADDLAQQEARFSKTLYDKATAAEWALPGDAALTAAVMSYSMPAELNAGVNLPEAFIQFGGKKAKQIMNTISDGVIMGQTTPEISKNVSTLINTLYKRQVDALVRTATNHASGVARNVMFNVNKDLLEGYRWISTLDNKTTLICGSRDQKVYQTNIGPMPPAHWNACSKDTLITTKRGKVPIQDVIVGDSVMTHTGEWKKVTAVMAKPHKGKITKLIDCFGRSVTLTDDHPVLTSMGYISVKDIKIGHKLFKNTAKFIDIKARVFGSFVENAVLIDSHNIVTECVERLVTYSISSKSAGMSSAINLNNCVVDKKINNIHVNSYLKIKVYIARIKKIIKHFLMKSRVFS